MQNVAAVVLDTKEHLIIGVFHKLGGRRLVRTTVTGSYATAQKSINALPVCGRGEPPPGAGSVQQPGDDDSSVDRLQCCVTHSVRPEQSQGVQSLRTGSDDVLHVVGDGQTAGDSDSEYLQRGHSGNVRQWRRQRNSMTSSAAGEYYFNTLFAVEVEIVETGPRLHVVNLWHSAVDIYRRDDNVRIICILAETVSRGDGAEVGCGDDVGCWANGRPLYDTGRYVTQCGRLTTVFGTV